MAKKKVKKQKILAAHSTTCTICGQEFESKQDIGYTVALGGWFCYQHALDGYRLYPKEEND